MRAIVFLALLAMYAGIGVLYVLSQYPLFSLFFAACFLASLRAGYRNLREDMAYALNGLRSYKHEQM